MIKLKIHSVSCIKFMKHLSFDRRFIYDFQFLLKCHFQFFCLESPCSSMPCFNGGKCKEVGGTYVCDCSCGYKGKQCEKKSIKHEKISLKAGKINANNYVLNFQ